MVARLLTFHGSPDRLREGIRTYREHGLPWLREASGFRGWIGLVDEGREQAVAITFWATQEDAAGFDAAGSKLTGSVAEGLEMTIDEPELYDVAVVEALALESGDS